MSAPVTLLITALGLGALLLAAVIVRFNLKRLHIARAASGATHEQLERIYTLVEQTGSAPPNGFVLARTNKLVPETRCLVPIPPELTSLPWAGRVVEITAADRVDFSFTRSSATEPSLLGKVYRLVQVPRHQTKNGTKLRNAFSPDHYVATSSELLTALRSVCAKYPNELLAYLLCTGASTFEFEPIDQARIGTSPAWVQDPEHQTCESCRKRLTLIMQMPGTMVSQKSFHRGTFYFFGCPSHPDETKTLGQFT